LSGTVQRINPTATILSGVVNYEVAIVIGKGSRFLKPDMTANVSIRTAQRNALVLPTTAIHGEGEQRFVYVQTDRGPTKRGVVIGSREASLTEIKKGLSPEDRVVLGEISPDSAKGPTR
jgi:multidrug efflux pump subunit AcrA (membrane-fusion protein)